MSTTKRGWQKVKLGDICEFRYGKNLPNTKRDGNGYPVYGSNGIVGRHSEPLTNGPTIIVGRKGSLGEVTFSSTPCWPIDTTYYIDESASDVELGWLTYCLKQLRLTELNRAAAIPGLNREDAYSRKLLLPPPCEQKRITAILNKADAIRCMRTEILHLANDFIMATFLDMFGNSNSMPIEEMIAKKYLLMHKDGNHGSNYPRANDFGNDGVPFFTAKNITKNGTLSLQDMPRLNNDKAKSLTIGWIMAGDVLLAHNATVGPVAIYKGEFPEALIGTSLTAFRPNPKILRPEYLASALRSEFFQRQLKKCMAQTTRNQVPITSQRRLSLPMVDIDLQSKFTLIFKRHALQLKYFSDSQAAANDLFSSLVQRAFRGKL